MEKQDIEEISAFHVHWCVVHNSQDMETNCQSVEEGMKIRYIKQWNISHEKKGHPVIYNSKELGFIILSEISQRKPSSVWYHLYVESENVHLIEIDYSGGYQSCGLVEEWKC